MGEFTVNMNGCEVQRFDTLLKATEYARRGIRDWMNDTDVVKFRDTTEGIIINVYTEDDELTDSFATISKIPGVVVRPIM